jgi:hypothetical protein
MSPSGGGLDKGSSGSEVFQLRILLCTQGFSERACKFLFNSLLRIRDVYPGSECLLDPEVIRIPNTRIKSDPDPHP